MKIIVVGAGIFGVTIALELSKKYNDVTLVDMNDDIMQNASKVNHNRLHFGFHYPRSKVTAVQSLDGYQLFYDYFSNAITSNFENYYMIEKTSNVSSREYEYFCDDLHLTYKKQFPKINMNFDRIESSYLTNEPIFDYDLIKWKLDEEIRKSGIKLILNKKIDNKKDLEGYDVVVNTSYFNINKINKIFDLNQTKLKIQTVIIPIFKYNISKMGLTIMDGKFCSVLPKGFNQNTFLLYHAKESVVYQTENTTIPKIWYYGKEIIKNEFLKKHVYDKIIVKNQINIIVKESKKYFRFLKDCDFVDYWQIVRVLPINDDDERLSIFDIAEKDNQKIISVLSGKIATCLLIANNIFKLI
jgi:hypothetical protein